jgi:hypothetical protein
MCVRKPAPIRSPRRRVASDLGDHVVEPAWAKRGRRGGKDELAHRQRIIVFDLRRKVPVAVEFPRKGLAANQFSGERFTRWSSVTASSFPFPSRTVEWLIYHSTVHCFESESSVDITADAVPELNRFSPVT